MTPATPAPAGLGAGPPPLDLVAVQGVGLTADGLIRLRHVLRSGRAGPRALTALPGGFVARQRGRGLEVDDIRVFSEGDDMRHLDRAASARTGVPHVRTFRDERERSLVLLVDLRPSMFWGTRRAFRAVAAAEAAVLAGWRAVGEGGRVGAVAWSAADPVVVPARGRDRGMIAVAGGIAAAHAAALAAAAAGAAEPTLAAGLDLARRLVPKGATVLVASAFDRLGESFDAALLQLARRADPVALVTVDAFERRPPAGDFAYRTTDGRAGRGGAGVPFDPDRDPRFVRLARLGVPALAIGVDDTHEAVRDHLESLDGRR